MKSPRAWMAIGLLVSLPTCLAQSLVVGGTIGIKGKPFSADVVEESTNVMGHGDLVHHESHWKLFRDAEGRTRGEYEYGEERQFQVQIVDPVGQVMIVLDPQTKTATIEHIDVPAKSPSSGDQPDKSIPGMTQEKLQDKEIEGFRASGTRYTHSINVGQNPDKRTIVMEIWYSPELQTTLLTSQEESPSQRNSMRLTNVRRGEPDPQLFRVPPGYKVKNDSGQR